MLARFLVNMVIVFLLLLVFAFMGTIVFPTLPTTSTSVGTFGSELLLLLLPVVLIAFIGFFLGRGIRNTKNSWEALGLTFVSAFLLGGVLGLLTVLNVAYSAHVNFGWLGAAWYDSVFTLFLIGSPLLLVFLA